MTTLPATRESPWRRAYRRPAWFVAAAAPALAVVAWLLPISGPADTDASADRALGDAPGKPPPEDLAAFLDVDRWGISLREVNARLEEEARRRGGSGLNPALKALGYVGLVVETDASTVLLTTTGGAVVRLEPGDPLPDGRILAEVGDNSITLRDANGGEAEVLELFPRPPTRPPTSTEAG